MNFDLVVLGLVAFFAIWGAFSGFSKQVAHALGGVAAIAAAAPLGRFFAEPMKDALKTSLEVGVVAATIVSFVAVYVLVRIVVGLTLKRLITGEDEKRASADRLLGFLLGGAKTAVAIWIGVSAATFIENNLVLAGRRYAFTPKNSTVVALSRQYNFIEVMQFSGAKDLVAAARVASDPKSAKSLKNDPDYLALIKDPRFKQLVSSDGWKKALESGDVRGLMQNNSMVELIHDPTMSHHLERLAQQAE